MLALGGWLEKKIGQPDRSKVGHDK